MKKIFKIYLTSTIVGFILFYPTYIVAATVHASHYAHLSWRYGSSFNVRYTPITSEVNWTSNIDTAISGWNSKAGSGIKRTSNVSHIMLSYYWGNTGWYAYASSSGNIRLNNITPAKYRNEVVAHELGHGLGLGHVNCSSEVMRETGFKGSHYPYEGDIQGFKKR